MSKYPQTARRLAAAAALLISIVSCDGGESPNGTNPSRLGDAPQPPPSGNSTEPPPLGPPGIRDHQREGT